MNIHIIFGPPGTGKTTALQNLLAEELDNGYKTNEIAYVSYTREGSYQGKERAQEKFNIADSDIPYFKTLHSIAFNHLSMRRSEVMGKEHYRQLSKALGMNFSGYYTAEFKGNDDRYLAFDMLHRNNPKTAESYLYNLNIDKLQFVRNNYKKFKHYFNLYDFTDMISLFIKKNEALPVKIAFIDEAQDLTMLQWQMIWIAFRDCKTIYIAGDDDQAIYEWSGADVEYFLRIRGSQTILNRSYRLPDNILNFANNMVKHISHRIDKQYHGTGEVGEVHFINGLNDINLDNGEDWLILSRNHLFLKEAIEYLKTTGHIFMHKKELSISTRKIEVINLYERIRKTGKITKEQEGRLIPHLKEEVVNLKQPWFEIFNWENDELMYYRDLIAKKINLNECKISIDTIHSIKGSEATNVILFSDITKQVMANYLKNPDSELRVFYVGATRAKKRLYVIMPTSKFEFPLRNYI